MFESRASAVKRDREKVSSPQEAARSTVASTESHTITATEGEDRFTPAAIQMFLGKLSD